MVLDKACSSFKSSQVFRAPVNTGWQQAIVSEASNCLAKRSSPPPHPLRNVFQMIRAWMARVEPPVQNLWSSGRRAARFRHRYRGVLKVLSVFQSVFAHGAQRGPPRAYSLFPSASSLSLPPRCAAFTGSIPSDDATE